MKSIVGPGLALFLVACGTPGAPAPTAPTGTWPRDAREDVAESAPPYWGPTTPAANEVRQEAPPRTRRAPEPSRSASTTAAPGT